MIVPDDFRHMVKNLQFEACTWNSKSGPVSYRRADITDLFHALYAMDGRSVPEEVLRIELKLWKTNLHMTAEMDFSSGAPGAVDMDDLYSDTEYQRLITYDIALFLDNPYPALSNARDELNYQVEERYRDNVPPGGDDDFFGYEYH